MDTKHQFSHIMASLSPNERHKKWIERIRSIVADRIMTEEQRVPSHTSLWRHWLRSCWTASLWRQSHFPDVYVDLPPPERCGWTMSLEGVYSIDWEDPDVQSMVENITSLMKGYKCKNKCGNRCGCKKSNYCGPGCECQGCLNLPIQQVEIESDFDTESSCSSVQSGNEDEADESDYGLETEVITDTDTFNLFTVESTII